jgi:hypothetical protein
LPESPARADRRDRATTKPPRNWPAILLLFFLAGFTAEVLTGSTPILVYLTNPFSFIFNPLLYGCGALLVREIVRRRGLGWTSVLWLGAAYGIFEEGLVINTWADPWAHDVCTLVKGVATGLCDYSRVGGINLLWALELTTFHAIISITIPILLVELIFPSRAARPWLRRRGIIACVVAEGICLLFGLLLNFTDFRAHGRPGPLLAPYLIEMALMAGCAALALTRRPRAAASSTRAAPRLWLLRVCAAPGLALVILAPSLFNDVRVPFEMALALNVVLLALGVWRVATWARCTGWNARHMLALATGGLGFLVLFWDPLLELLGQAGGKPTRGTAVVALVYLIGLIVLARRTTRRLSQPPASATPDPVAPPPSLSLYADSAPSTS